MYVDVSGKYACFTRPELSVERVSYDVMTPSAARGVIDAIYWHPGIVNVIDSIQVVNEIRFTHIKRNGISISIPTRKVSPILRSDKLIQRNTVMLKNVRYIIGFHLEVASSVPKNERQKLLAKGTAIMSRRIDKGQCFSTPYLGTREFSCSFSSSDGFVPNGYYAHDGIRDLGMMLYDMRYVPNDENPHSMFFRAIMNNGVIKVSGQEVYQ